MIKISNVPFDENNLIVEQNVLLFRKELWYKWRKNYLI